LHCADICHATAALLSFSSAAKQGDCTTSDGKTWQSFIKVNGIYLGLNSWVFIQQKEKAESFLVNIMRNATRRKLSSVKHIAGWLIGFFRFVLLMILMKQKS